MSYVLQPKVKDNNKILPDLTIKLHQMTETVNLIPSLLSNKRGHPSLASWPSARAGQAFRQNKHRVFYNSQASKGQFLYSQSSFKTLMG